MGKNSETTVVRENNSCFGATTVTRTHSDGHQSVGYGSTRESADKASSDKAEAYNEKRGK